MSSSVAQLSQRRDASPIARTAALVAALRSPRCYSHPAPEIKVLETHISYVILAGSFAYKIKKPVTLPFLDFSSLEARRHFCHEEFRLNHRTSPAIYLDVVPICGTIDAPRMDDGGGVPIEYALKMRRFSQEGLLDRLASLGSLDPATIDELAAEVARLHAGAKRAGPGSEYGLPDEVLRNAFENFREIETLHDTGKTSIPPELYGWTLDHHHALAGILAQRKHEGFVREGHGDLHLGNIVLFEGRPAIFDCIEFSPSLRWLDVMSDVAFVMMDLLRHARDTLAWRFLNAYLERTGDYGGLAVLRFYLVYRAMVRAKIACIRSSQARPGSPEKTQAEEAYKAYLQLALRTTEPAKRTVILMHGLSGSGKTTLSQELVELLGAIRLRSDIERKRAHGLDQFALTDSRLEAGLYAPRATERTYEQLASLCRDVLRNGFSVIVDATFLQRAQRRRFEAIASAAGARFTIVHCVAPPETLAQRVAERSRARKDASEAGLEVLERQRETQQALEDDEWFVSIACDTSLAGSGQAIAQALQKRFAPLEIAPCATSTSSTATPTESARFIS